MNNNTQGSIIIAFLVILVLTALGAAILMRGANERKVSMRSANSTSAMWVAEAGLNKVLYEYNTNNCAGMVNETSGVACSSCTSCGTGNKKVSATLATYGDYDATLDSTNTTAQTTGYVPSRSSASKIQRRIQATIGRPQIFDHGIFAQGQVTLSNNALVDSFDSSVGNYGGANILSNGNVGTNGTSAGIININNNATVQGNLSTGVGGTVIMDNGSTVSGTTTHTNSVALPAVVVPSSLTSLSSGGTYSLGNNATGTLNSGDYKYTKLDLHNNAILNINGNVRLYLTGATALTTQNNVNINIASGANLTLYVDGVLSADNNVLFNSASHLPSKFNIYSTYTGSNGVVISNNGTTYAGIYAPQTNITLSNNDAFYGAVVGKTVNLSNNGEVHYDQALATLSNPFENAITSNWQEI